jgi:deoxyribonuclease IV
MYKYGLKLWSTNKQYITEAIKLYEENVYKYIELFVVPNSFNKFISKWKNLKIPYVIHAPHFYCGLNLAKHENLNTNIKLARETFKFANELQASKIIFHPGVDGDIKETVRQLKILNDHRILIENKPYYALVKQDGKHLICNGHSPQDIKLIIQKTNVGFCLDIGHAIYSANAKNINSLDYLKQFIKLDPKMFHLTDGNIEGILDQHKHIKKGSFNFKEIFKLIPEKSFISIETEKSFKNKLCDFKNDIATLKKITEIKLSIKLAQKCDCRDILKLTNDPIVRQNSLNTAIVTLKNHTEWFNKKINDKDHVFFVIRNKEKNLVGQVRFEQTSKKQYTISISIAPKFRSKGLAYILIKKTSNKIITKHKKSIINAFIRKNNISSIKSFLKAGYKILNKEKKEFGNVFKLKYD